MMQNRANGQVKLDCEDSVVGFLGGLTYLGSKVSNLRASQSLTTRGYLAPYSYSRYPTCVEQLLLGDII